MGVYWLGSPQSQQASQVGGKAAQLGRLAWRYRVPPGFCLPVQAAGSAPLVPGWQWPIRRAYRALGAQNGQPEVAVAVRSSAVDEDGRGASFAGMHESYLNIRGEAALIEAVSACLASAASERARAYRQAQGLGPAGGVAVLIQEFVPADVSCVVFSADPLRGDPSQMLVNAAWGLGESLVGGMVTPDLYRLDTDGRVLDQQIACKTCMSIPGERGTHLVNVPRGLQRDATLSPEQLSSLAALARSLQAFQGWPVDVECSFADGQLYLLQCRPITALAQPSPSAWSLPALWPDSSAASVAWADR